MPHEVKPNATPQDIELMESILAEGRILHKYAVRIQTVLNRVRNIPGKTTAEILGINVATVSRHVNRYNAGGVEALLKDKTRKPGKTPIDQDIKDAITKLVCNEKPSNATHWTTRDLAKRFRISHVSVNKILNERGLKPHLVSSFQLSEDPEFESKLKDVIGLYLDPPENSIVLCVDEKSQIQALERSQPILPLRPGVPERQTHDYYRHGTTTLFAALNVVSGKVIGECRSSHKADDYVSFLKLLDRKTPKSKILHIVADNYAAHKAPKVKEYLQSKPERFVTHFIPTHSSWLNMVERWFAEITNKRIRRESWSSVHELERAIVDFIAHWNESKKCFRWTKSFETVKDKITKAKS